MAIFTGKQCRCAHGVACWRWCWRWCQSPEPTPVPVLCRVCVPGFGAGIWRMKLISAGVGSGVRRWQRCPESRRRNPAPEFRLPELCYRGFGVRSFGAGVRHRSRLALRLTVCGQANRLADHMGRQCVNGNYEGHSRRSDFKKPAISHQPTIRQVEAALVWGRGLRELASFSLLLLRGKGRAVHHGSWPAARN